MLCTNTARAGLALALGMALALGGAAAVVAVPQQALAKAPAKVTGVTASGTSTSSVKVSWKKVSGVTGYQVKIGTKKTFSGAATVKTSRTSRSFQGLNCGKRYYFKVRGYKALGAGRYSYGSWSSTVCGATMPSRVTSLKVDGTSCKKLRISWDTIPGATGYQICYGDKGSKSYKTALAGYEEKTLAVSRNTGWVKVRAYVQGTRKTYGSWSSVKGVSMWRYGTLNKFSWSQLKSYANQIAKATTSQEALAKAKELGLLGSSGKLTGNEYKCVSLPNGNHCHVQILGFWHDKKTSGGRAGITFGFKDIPSFHSMNSSYTNSGGWRSSGMRAWLNSTFYESLPYDLRSRIVSVSKLTNNKGKTTSSSAVTSTSDKLWLLSMRECYGSVSVDDNFDDSRSVYDAEGSQYKLYTDNGVSLSNYSFLKKQDTSDYMDLSWWWLRSPYAHDSDYFHYVDSSGDWNYYYADDSHGVSPGFCF